MKYFARQLESNLKQQLKYYEEMEELSIEKKNLIIKGDAEKLATLDRNIESLACQVLTLEQKRLQIQQETFSKDAQIVDIVKNLPDADANIINEIRLKLKSTLSNIQKINTMNIYLIENSIKWIEHSVTTIANYLAPESAAYTFQGKSITKSPYTYNFSSSSTIEQEA